MFPEEINSDNFTIFNSISRGPNSWTSDILYNDKKLVIQTPVLPLTFDLNKYSYPNNNKTKYSITVSLYKHITGVEILQEVVEGIDKCIQDTINDEIKKGVTYHNSVHKPIDAKYPHSLRLKMVSNKTRFKCDILLNGKIVSDKIEDVKKLLVKGVKAKYQIQLNPIWKAGEKYGVSYQVLAMDIQKHVTIFRNRCQLKKKA